MNADARHVNRRGFVRGAAGLGLVVAGLPLLAGCGSHAATVGRKYKGGMPRVAYLSSDTLMTSPAPGIISADAVRNAFQQGLQDLGYTEGKTITVDYHFEPDGGRLSQAARDAVRAPMDLIVAADVPAMQIARQATQTTPIVAAFLNDPIATGAVASLARPGGNVTGPTLVALGINAKELQIFKATVPTMKRIGVLWNTTLPDANQQYNELVNAAPALGVEIIPMGVQAMDDFPAAYAKGNAAGIDGMIGVVDSLTVNAAAQEIEYVRRYQLPSACAGRGWPAIGGLESYGTDPTDLYRRAASYVDRVLKGANPAELPVERPNRFDLVINLTAARELGITVPDSVLVQAAEVIQ